MALFINLAGEMPVFQKAFFRNLVAIVMSYIILARSPEKFKIKKSTLPYLFMRAGFGTIGVLANFYAISTANMSDAMMLNKLSPFFAMLTSIIVLKEAADGFQWAAILTAIAGAVFVVKPSFIFGTLGISGDSVFPLVIALIGLAPVLLLLHDGRCCMLRPDIHHIGLCGMSCERNIDIRLFDRNLYGLAGSCLLR